MKFRQGRKKKKKKKLVDSVARYRYNWGSGALITDAIDRTIHQSVVGFEEKGSSIMNACREGATL